jgi:hypothetical protein
VKIDHLQVIRSEEYAEVIADRLAVLPRGRASVMTVVHEKDDSCCRREPWGISLDRLLEIAAKRRAVTSGLVVLESAPDGAA